METTQLQKYCDFSSTVGICCSEPVLGSLPLILTCYPSAHQKDMIGSYMCDYRTGLRRASCAILVSPFGIQRQRILKTEGREKNSKKEPWGSRYGSVAEPVLSMHKALGQQNNETERKEGDEEERGR